MAAPAEETGAGSPTDDRIAAVLDAHARRHVGVAVGVSRGDATWTVVRGSAGRERGEPRADTIFEIGSITKVFTATLLASLAEQGALALDDPVNRYLPAETRLKVRGRPITLADLATHTSGLPRLPSGLLRLSFPRHRANPYALHARAPRARDPHDPAGARAGAEGPVLELRRRAARPRPRGARGRDVRTARPGANLRAAGPRRHPDPRAGRRRARLADGHGRRGAPVPHWDLPTLAGAGALRSTVADLLRFLRFQLAPGPGELGRAVRATHEQRYRRLAFEQCLGWTILPVRGLRVVWHNGGTGGFRSLAGFVRERETAVVALSNCSRSVDTIGFRALEAVSG